MNFYKHLGLILLTASFSFGAVITFSSDPTTSSAVPFGNSLIFNNAGGIAGLTLKITGWGRTGAPSGTTFQTAQVRNFNGGGLGTCDQLEGLNCSSANHTVDNVGNLNFIMFQFSQAVNITNVNVNAYGTNKDADATYFLGNTFQNSYNLSGKTLTTILKPTGEFFGGVNSNVTEGQNNYNHVIGAPLGSINTLLFGGSVSTTDVDDYFKVRSITFTVDPTGGTGNPVPEPTTYLTLGAALLAFGAYRRNKQ